jgi:hypothetical protein
MSYHDYNGDDTIDSRELVELLTEMATDRAMLVDDVNDAETDEDIEEAQEALDVWDEEHDEAYKALEDFCNEAEQYCADWHHGVQLILEEHWTDYAEELARDIGALPRDLPDWVVIDWEQTGENLKTDYTSVDWGGYTYWVR